MPDIHDSTSGGAGRNILAASGGTLTMSSREIAELVEKRHDNVKRTIEALAERGVIVQPQIEDEQDTDAMGRQRTTSVFRLEKRDTYIVVAQLSPEFTARLVDRWQELEAQAARPALPDFADPVAAARAWADEREQVLKSQKQIAAMSPKVEAFDALMNADGLYGLQNAARAIGARPNKFVQWLKQTYLFYQGSALVPRITYIQSGVFEVKTTVVDDKARPTTFVTPKGVEYLRKRVPQNILVSEQRRLI